MLGQGHLLVMYYILYLSIFQHFSQSFLLMLLSYLYHTTGLYLCITFISFFSAIFYPRARNLVISYSANIDYSDDLAVLPLHHFENLDSLCVMSPHTRPIHYLITTVISHYRPKSKLQLRCNNRTAVLKEVTDSDYCQNAIS